MLKTAQRITKKLLSSRIKAAGQLDGLDLEVEADETEYKAFEILDQVVENSESFWVPDDQDHKYYQSYNTENKE